MHKNTALNIKDETCPAASAKSGAFVPEIRSASEVCTEKCKAPKHGACVRMIQFDIKGDERGSLIALEKGYNLPFDIRRFYYIFDTQSGITRGCHAHKKLKQVLIAVSGSVDIFCEYNGRKEKYTLDRPDQGLLIEGYVWREMKNFGRNTVLAVLADDYYNEADYIRCYNTFLGRK